MPLLEAERLFLQSLGGLELPRHTSYPSVPYWDPDPVRACHAMGRVLAGEKLGVSPIAKADHDSAELYVHIPFCEMQCFYCGCNRITLPRANSKSNLLGRTLSALVVEIRALAELRDLKISQVHFGGGTPNYLSGAELGLLMREIMKHVRFAPTPRFSVEIDARRLKLSFLSTLKDWGFGQASIGVQDLDPQVQKFINREQSFEQIAEATDGLRSHGVKSLNFDLIYGLPGQTPETWDRTLELCLRLRPSRFSIFRLALLPERFPWQRGLAGLPAALLPHGMTTADLFFRAKDRLEEAGYCHLGLDHFALASDPLWEASEEGCLGRSFQGYVEKNRMQTIGLGPSALSFFHGVYGQRLKNLHEWLAVHEAETLAEGGASRSPLAVGWERSRALSSRDAAQFQAIQSVYSQGVISASCIGGQGKDFALAPGHVLRHRYLDAGVLTEDSEGGLRLTPRLGRLLSRLVASHFDDYFARSEGAPRVHPLFSQTPQASSGAGHSLAF